MLGAVFDYFGETCEEDVKETPFMVVTQMEAFAILLVHSESDSIALEKNKIDREREHTLKRRWAKLIIKCSTTSRDHNKWAAGGR